MTKFRLEPHFRVVDGLPHDGYCGCEACNKNRRGDKWIAIPDASLQPMLDKLEKASLLASDDVQSLVQSVYIELRKWRGNPGN